MTLDEFQQLRVDATYSALTLRERLVRADQW